MYRSYDRLVSRLSRRDLVKILGMAGAAAVAQPILGRGLLAQPLFPSYPFTLGVASGDPLSDAVVIWTRLAPRPLVDSSITSNGDGNAMNGDWARVKPDNPHIRFHSGRRGYIACTATPRALRADFKILERVSIPDQPISTAGSLVVEAGHVGAQPA